MAGIGTYRVHGRALMRLGLPLVGTSLAAFLINTVDTLMLGWYGVPELAAATIATMIFFVVLVVGFGFAHAVTPLVAAAVEEGDETRARRVTRMALWLSAVYSLLAIVLLWPAEEIMRGIGQLPGVSVLAEDYLRIAVWGTFPAIGLMVMRALLGALHLTAVQLWVTLAALCLNAALNWVLIFGNLGAPELGIRGAAIASVLVQSTQFLGLAVYAHLRRPDYNLFQRLWRIDPQALGQVFRLGLPIGITGLAESGLFAASSVMMGWIGEVELAAHGVALQLVALTFMFHVGMSQAATIRAGGHFGRRDPVALREGARAAYVIAVLFGFAVVVVFVTIPGPLVALFVDPTDPQRDQIIAIGVGLVMVSALFQFVDSAQIVALSLLRGVQDTRVPMWLANVSYWIIGVPVSYALAFPLGLGPVGLWLGLTVGLAAAAVSLSWRFWTRAVPLVEARAALRV